LKNIKKLSDFDNVIITDAKGYVSFCDVADLNVLKVINSWPEDIIGKHITQFYKDLDENNSTIFQALNYGKTTLNLQQEMQTSDKKMIKSVSSTFPLTDGIKVIGAIEFSNRYFQKEKIQSLEKIQSHKMY